VRIHGGQSELTGSAFLPVGPGWLSSKGGGGGSVRSRNSRSTRRETRRSGREIGEIWIRVNERVKMAASLLPVLPAFLSAAEAKSISERARGAPNRRDLSMKEAYSTIGWNAASASGPASRRRLGAELTCVAARYGQADAELVLDVVFRRRVGREGKNAARRARERPRLLRARFSRLDCIRIEMEPRRPSFEIRL